MAIWQYSFWGIPKDALLKKYSLIPENITEDDFNDTCWFDYFDEKIFIDSIDYLKPNTHWDEQTVFFGTYEGDSITISIENNAVEDIYFRMDFRNENYLLMVDNFVRSLLSNNLIIIDENLYTIFPCSDNILGEIKKDRDRVKNTLGIIY